MGRDNEKMGTTVARKSSRTVKISTTTDIASAIPGAGRKPLLDPQENPHMIICGCGGSYLNAKFDPGSGSPRLAHCNSTQHIKWVSQGNPNLSRSKSLAWTPGI
jgi:hypothetical protein